MRRSTESTSVNDTLRNKLFDWIKSNLCLSLGNILAALIALGATVGVIVNFIHANQLELGALVLPFTGFLDLMFLALVATLFICKPSSFLIALGFVAILVVPIVGSTVVIGALQSLSGTNNFPSQAVNQQVQGVVNLVLALVYFRDIVNRIRKTKQST